jgi:hypothetical protein
MFAQYSNVVLLRDDPVSGLKSGAVGVVVEVYSRPSVGYDVEFMDERGRTLALLTLKSEDLKAAK